MSISRMEINKFSDEHFVIIYDNEGLDELHVERGKVVRFLDDCVDALMRLTNRMRSTDATNAIEVFNA